jgi:YbbR domain-containing protein
VRRIRDFLVRNWPLRLGAILLATLLYTGLVLGQNIRTWSGSIPVDALRPPANATVISEIPPVTQVRYRAALDVGVLSPNSFTANIDLSRVDVQPNGPPVTVPVNLIALQPGVTIVDYEPREVQVQLDPVDERQVPVTVTLGAVPDGVNVGPPQIDPATVDVRGGFSRVNAISEVVARVAIDASALNVDRDIELVAVDSNGNEVPNVTLDPERVRVRIAVARELANRTLPVVPVLAGDPAFGYRVSAITVEPLVVTVSGEAVTVSALENAATLPISIAGRTTDLEASIGLDLPSGVSVNGSDQMQVMIKIEPETGSRTFFLVLHFVGTAPNTAYDLGSVTPQVVLSGPLATLDKLDPSTLNATVDLSGLPEGTSDVDVQFSPPPGLTLVSMTPEQLSVVVAKSTPAP